MRKLDSSPGDASTFSTNTRPTKPALLSGNGAVVRDANGTMYLDFCSQTLNANLGQCHPTVTEAIVKEAKRLTCASSRFSSDVAITLHTELRKILPDELNTLNLACMTGSLANECALKMVRKKTGKQKVVSRRDGHLGQSMETMRVSGKHWNSRYLGERNAEFFPAPNCYRCPYGMSPETCSVECLDDMDRYIQAQRHEVAAVIVEPVMADAGMLVPPTKYHSRLNSICKSGDVFLIWDEVQTGFGWLGKMFAMDVYNVVPDVLTLGKGFGAGLPLAGAAFSKSLDVLEYGEHEMTGGASPLSCAASIAMLSVLQKTDLLQEVSQKGDVLRAGLERLKDRFAVMGDVRGLGFMLAVEFVQPGSNEPASEIASAALQGLYETGVLSRISKVGASSNVLQLKPPLVTTEEQIDEFLFRFNKVLTNIMPLRVQ